MQSRQLRNWHFELSSRVFDVHVGPFFESHSSCSEAVRGRTKYCDVWETGYRVGPSAAPKAMLGQWGAGRTYISNQKSNQR